MKESTELRATRMAYVASFLITTVLFAFLSFTQPIKSNIAAGYLWGIFLVLGTVAIGACRGKRHGLLGFFLFAAILNIVIVPPEIYLRLKGFRYETQIQFGYPRPYQLSAAERDETLFWTFPRLRPGVNSYGFEGAEPARPKPAGAYRILYLGNSCTQQGFPAMTGLILRETHPEVEVFNFANPGYSSYQGKVIARNYLKELAPDLLVVSFGWNDRWLAYGAPDEEKKIAAEGGGAARRFLGGIYTRWKLLQFCRKSLAPVLGNEEPLDTPRVPAGQFKRNLEEIGAAADELGVPVIFATEPSSHAALGVSDDVIASTYARSKEASLALFREYNDITRAVAGERSSWHCIDLDALVSSRSDVREIFTGEGIYFSKGGQAVIADIEARYILGHFLARHGT